MNTTVKGQIYSKEYKLTSNTSKPPLIHFSINGDKKDVESLIEFILTRYIEAYSTLKHDAF